MRETVEFVTDTAELSIFDPACLRNRVYDDPDWWTIADEALKEMNKGNMMLIDLGSDGYYTLQIHDDQCQCENQTIAAKVACISGRLFIGAGEMIPGGEIGLDLNEIYRGILLSIEPGVYEVTVSLADTWMLDACIKLARGRAENNFKKDLKLYLD